MNSAVLQFNPEVLESGVIKIPVSMNSVPQNFFGIAFHVHINSQASFEYLGSEIGNAVNSADPLILSQYSGDEIIFGFSLKRGDVATIQNGELVTFYLKPLDNGHAEFEFNNGILTTLLPDGQRFDLRDVQWLGASADFYKIEGSTEENNNDTFAQTHSQQMNVSNWNESALKTSSFAQDVDLPGLYFFLGVVFLIMLLTFLSYLFLRKIRS